jgi:hypothetical protein
MKRLPLAATLALSAVAATACHDSTDAHVSVQYVQTVGTGIQGFVASLQAGQTAKVFGVDADSLPAPALEMTTPASGFVVVSAALLDTLGTIGAGSTAIELRPNATFSVKVQIDSVSPLKACTDCLGAKSFLLPASHQRVAADSMWMVWSATSGGNAITK